MANTHLWKRTNNLCLTIHLFICHLRNIFIIFRTPSLPITEFKLFEMLTLDMSEVSDIPRTREKPDANPYPTLYMSNCGLLSDNSNGRAGISTLNRSAAIDMVSLSKLADNKAPVPSMSSRSSFINRRTFCRRALACGVAFYAAWRRSLTSGRPWDYITFLKHGDRELRLIASVYDFKGDNTGRLGEKGRLRVEVLCYLASICYSYPCICAWLNSCNPRN